MQNHSNGLTHPLPAPLGSYAPMSSLGSPEFFPELPRRELTLKDLWGVLMRRKGIILAVTLAIFALAALYCATAKRLYKATATIQVQKDSADALSLDQMMGPTETAGDAVESSIALQTEALILQSDSLALSVVKTLDLEHTPDFHGGFSLLGWLMKPFLPAGIADAANVPSMTLPAAARTSSKPSKATSRSSRSPAPASSRSSTSAPTPRTAAPPSSISSSQDLQDYNFSTKHDATQQASLWLGHAALRPAPAQRRSPGPGRRPAAQLRHLHHGPDRQPGPRADLHAPPLTALQQATSQLGQAESPRAS